MTRQLTILGLILLLFTACEENASITFEETVYTPKTIADVYILYPNVKEGHSVSEQINSEIKDYISRQINFKDTVNLLSIKDAVEKFDNELKQFKNDFPETPQQWELSIEGEVLHKTPDLICVGMSSYMYTGGAHGNDRIDFLNFNPKTGKLLNISDLIDDISEFRTLVETHLKKEIETGKNTSMDDYFFGEGFKLPETLGFNEEGIIVLYNKYEIASYAQGITEFVIPYDEVDSLLKIMP